jgi:hypothetical protein
MAKRAKLRAWTKDDVRVLKSSARQKTPAAKIAKSLKRTVGATRAKAFCSACPWIRGGKTVPAPSVAAVISF